MNESFQHSNTILELYSQLQLKTTNCRNSRQSAARRQGGSPQPRPSCDCGNVRVLASPHNPRNLVQVLTSLTRHQTVAGIRTSNCIMIISEINRCLQLPDRRHTETETLFIFNNQFLDAVVCRYLSRYIWYSIHSSTQKVWEAEGIKVNTENLARPLGLRALVLSRIWSVRFSSICFDTRSSVHTQTTFL